MKKVILFISLLLTAAVYPGCDTVDNNPQDQEPDVYVAGVEIDDAGNSYATVWKNGEAQNLWQGGATSVYVSENKLYVAGWGFNAQEDHRNAKLWKNGVVKDLTKGVPWNSFVVRTSDDANSVFVSGADVYVAGSETNEEGYMVATVWKNEKAEVLPNGFMAHSVFVSGNDVYVAGIEKSEKTGITIATVWKNGEIYQTLTDEVEASRLGKKSGGAKSVFVSGNDVYVLEEENISNLHPLFAQNSIRVWKNGILLFTLYEGSYGVSAGSLFVSGSDVYVCGQLGVIPKLWKNGIEQTLSTKYNYGVANSVYVSGNDVYVIGREWEIPAQVPQEWDTTLWKNGIGKTLSNGKTKILPYSVFVVEK